MINKNFIKFADAINHIEEADVLLFRGQGLVSRLIQRVGEGTYSHVGLATWHNCCRVSECGTPLLEITEFREGYGGRTTNLYTSYHNAIENKIIDVYRVATPLTKLRYDAKINDVVPYTTELRKKSVTNYMRRLTGLPYGWSKIWWIATHKLAFFRLFYNPASLTDDKTEIDLTNIYPVCSTAVAACFSKYGYDLVPNRADQWTEPSDLSRSAILNYLFTLTS